VPFTNSWLLRAAASSSCVVGKENTWNHRLKVKSSLEVHGTIPPMIQESHFLRRCFFQNVDQLHGVFHGDSFRSRSAKSIYVVATRTFVAEDKGEEVD